MTDDHDIIAGLKSPEMRNQAFSQLVAAYSRRLYWHIRKIVINHDDTDDILQNTFIKVWNHIDSFREDSSLYTWLYRIATNESVTFLNQQKKRAIFSMEEASEYLIRNLETDPYFNGDEIQLKLQKAIAQLPEKQRLVFNMKYFDNIKYQDMAQILETSEGALKASYHHAVRKIEDYMTNNE